MSLFKVLSPDEIDQFIEYGAKSPPTDHERKVWEVLHPVCRASWAKNFNLCYVCSKPRRECDKVWDHDREEPDRVLLKCYLAKYFPNHDTDKLAETVRWCPGDGFWGMKFVGQFVGIEVDGYVHS